MLAPNAIYIGDNGRLLCSSVRCAGASAYYTGRDLSGAPVERMTCGDVAEWFSAMGRAPTCQCGSVTLSPIASRDGYPEVR